MSLSKPYSGLRVRKSIQTQKNKNNMLFSEFARSTQIRKQLSTKLNSEVLDLPTLKTQLMINSKKIHIPYLPLGSGRTHFANDINSPKGKTVTANNSKTTHLVNKRYLNDFKPPFRVKNVSYLLSPLKGSFSSVMTPKAQTDQIENTECVQNFEQFKENDKFKINCQSTRQTETKSIKRLKNEKCFIATTRKLPFSLQKRNLKRKFTEKTNFTSTAQDLFELDISTIMDENEPDTPFLMKRDSELESIINMA